MRIHTSDRYMMPGSAPVLLQGGHAFGVMQGGGIGSIFSNIFRGVVPFVGKLLGLGKRAAQGPVGRAVVKAARKTAMDAGLNLASDVLKGENVKASLKQNLHPKILAPEFVKHAEANLKSGGQRPSPKSKKNKSVSSKKKKNKKKNCGSNTTKKNTSKKKKNGKNEKKSKQKKATKAINKKKLTSTCNGKQILKLWL